MKGADYIAETLARHGVRDVFLITGGACAFMVDAISRHPDMRYFCFQHEQAAAMAADAVWRVGGSMGATMATSGPGATNLLTGIACSYFNSIPSIHITGQVNLSETKAYGGAKVRQAGFQETKIVDMARPITKYAVQVHDAESLRREMAKALYIANSGRKGPVLIDIPMDVQQIDVGDVIEMADDLQSAGAVFRRRNRSGRRQARRGAQRRAAAVGPVRRGGGPGRRGTGAVQMAAAL